MLIKDTGRTSASGRGREIGPGPTPRIPTRNSQESPPIPTRNSQESPHTPARNSQESPHIPTGNSEESPHTPTRNRNLHSPQQETARNLHSPQQEAAGDRAAFMDAELSRGRRAVGDCDPQAGAPRLPWFLAWLKLPIWHRILESRGASWSHWAEKAEVGSGGRRAGGGEEGPCRGPGVQCGLSPPSWSGPGCVCPCRSTWGLPGGSSCGQRLDRGSRGQEWEGGDVRAWCRQTPLVSHERGECVLAEPHRTEGCLPSREGDPCFVRPSLHLGQVVTEGRPVEGL